MHQQDAGRRRPHQPGAFYIVGIPRSGEGRTGDPGEAGDKHQSQGQNDVALLARPQDGDDHQGQQDTGKGRQRVVQAHQDLIGQTAEVARQGADGRTADGADGHRGQGNDGSGPRALKHPAENVPAEFIGPHQMVERRPCQLGPHRHGLGIVGRPEHPQQDQRRQESGQNQARPQVAVHVLFHASSPNLRRGSMD